MRELTGGYNLCQGSLSGSSPTLSRTDTALTIVRQTTVTDSGPLLAYLLGPLGLKRRDAKNLLKFGAVAVNGAAVRQFDHPLAIGDTVTLGSAQAATAGTRLEAARIQILYEDADLIVVEKPAGLLTVATETDKTDTLFVRLNRFLQARGTDQPDRALVVHRLDRETSGLVLLAKSSEVKDLLQAAWHQIDKTYLAIVIGWPEPPSGTITSYLVETKSLQVVSSDQPAAGGREATTHYQVLQSRGEFSLLEVRLETGRKHQIRVHLAGLGYLVAGDRRYGARLDPCRRLALHASALSLNHPLTGQRLTFTSPLPAALHKLFPAWK